MKKSNVIMFVLLALASAFFLWLWYFLGLNRIDEPLDLVLSIVWWAVVVAAIAVIVKMERTRRRRVRTVYVGEGAAFNSEKGLMPLTGERSVQDALASILEGLAYDFTREDFPDKEEFQPRFFVRTKEFKAEKREGEPVEADHPTAGEPRSEQKTWKGEVFVVDTKEERPFDTPEELAGILASLERAA